jgi:hypothetical protein
VAQNDPFHMILAGDLHRELHPLWSDIIKAIGAGQIVERRQTDKPACADQERVIFGVRVGAANQPVQDQRIDECPAILQCTARIEAAGARIADRIADQS